MSAPRRREFRAPPLPRVSIGLMALFLVGGSAGLLIDWPAGPAHLNWGIWLLVFGGYVFLLSAVFFYVRTGR